MPDKSLSNSLVRYPFIQCLPHWSYFMMRVPIKAVGGSTTEATAGKGWQVHAHYLERGHITAYVGWLSTKKIWTPIPGRPSIDQLLL